MKYSKTFIANIVTVLVFVLPLFGFEIIDQNTITDLVTKFMGVVSIAYVFYGRYKNGGINILGFKKK